MNIVVDVFVILCSLLLSGFFSSSETALTSLNELKVKHLIEEKGEKAKHLVIWLEHPHKVLNTILIGNNVTNILSSVLMTRIVAHYTEHSVVALTTGIMTFLILLFGEVTPKTFAKIHPEKLALFFIKFLRILYIVLYPFSWFLNRVVVILIKIMGGDVENKNPKITEDELEFMVTVGEEEGVIENDKKEMIHNIIDIKDLYVKDIMVPRVDMAVLDKNMSLDEVMDYLKKIDFSRVPVYEGKMDNIVGILHYKNLLKLGFEDLTVENIFSNLRDAMFVPETKKIDQLLREFRKDKVHLAVVVDEYGGVSGIVTLEDILEEIVGEIWDEYDVAIEDVVELGPDRYLVDARMHIDDFCERFYIEKTDKMVEYETLGGLIFEIAGEIPEIGSEYSINDHKLIVREMSQRSIDRVEFVAGVSEPEGEEG